MPDTLTIAAAARLCGCDRRTLQRAIHAGRLHLDAQHCLSRDALIAAGYLVLDTPHQTPHITPQSEPQGTPQPPELFLLLGRLTIALEGLWHEVRQLRTDLRQSPPVTPQIPPQQTPRPTPQATPRSTPHIAPQVTPPPPRGPYDAAAAFARMQALQQHGLTLAQIAAQLDADGLRTRHGKTWHKSSVAYVLKTYGR